MKRCVSPEGHDWRRQSPLGQKSKSALVLCVREGCGEVGYEMPTVSADEKKLAQKLGHS